MTVWYFDETERQIAKAQQANKGKEELQQRVNVTYYTKFNSTLYSLVMSITLLSNGYYSNFIHCYHAETEEVRSKIAEVEVKTKEIQKVLALLYLHFIQVLEILYRYGTLIINSYSGNSSTKT